MYDPVHRHLPLGHRLQQAGLGLGRSPVDLIRQQDLVHHHPFPVFELSGFHIVDRYAGHIPRQRIRRKLYPAETAGRGLCQHPCQRSLSHTRHILQQHMPADHKAHQQILHHIFLTDKNTVDALPQCFDHLKNPLFHPASPLKAYAFFP